MSDLTLAQARLMIDAALAEAKTLNILEAVAVVDEAGQLIAFAADNCTIGGGRIGAIGKAMASALFAQSSANLETAVGAGAWVLPPLTSLSEVPKPTLPGVAAAFAPGRQPIYAQGALPIMLDGMVAGAIGCGGGTSAQDEQCAQAGLAALHP